MDAAPIGSRLMGRQSPATDLYAGSEGIYLLPHHPREIERLKIQHEFILSSAKGVLLTTPLSKKKIKVLDAGASDGMLIYDQNPIIIVDEKVI